MADRPTRALMEAAGIKDGMKVLDLGTGAGDVAMLAAKLVGPDGAVVGIDLNPRVLETARERALAAGFANLTFVEGDFREVTFPEEFDAVVGRLVLMYQADPADALRTVTRWVSKGGIVALQEVDFRLPVAYAASVQSSALYRQVIDWLVTAFTRTGAHTSLGFGLHAAFIDSGLGAPTMWSYGETGGGPEWPGFDWLLILSAA